MIEAQSLRKVFGTPRGGEVVAVRDATFAINPGEIFGLLGPNGAGKTTLLRMLGTIILPSSGTCTVAGVPTHESPEQARRHIGFLSGNTRLYGRLTGRELLQYFGRLYEMPDDKIAERTEELTSVLTMGDFIDRRCETLSTGQTQKVSIARVILHDPDVLILDEPTLGLDIMTSRAILEFIQDARDRGRSIVFSTHYMSEAELLCDRIAMIHQGSILALDTKAALYASTGTDNLNDTFLSLVDAAEAHAT
jgi:sodium transport system ATP-binding protein